MKDEQRRMTHGWAQPEETPGVSPRRLCPLPVIASNPEIGVREDEPIVLYCKGSARAARAAQILLAAGDATRRGAV